MNIFRQSDSWLSKLEWGVKHEADKDNIADLYSMIGDIYFRKHVNRAIGNLDYVDYMQKARSAYLNTLSIVPNNLPVRNKLAITFMLSGDDYQSAYNYLMECKDPVLICSRKLNIRIYETAWDKILRRLSKGLFRRKKNINMPDQYIELTNTIEFYEMERIALRGILAFLMDDESAAAGIFDKIYTTKKNKNIIKYLETPENVISILRAKITPDRLLKMKSMIKDYKNRIE